ncbi:MAG: hypothetical protein ABIH92_03340, partial [Nanoarchaeota archaeon]
NTVPVLDIVQVLKEKSEDLVGKVMTQVEASIPPGQQCNAAKQIVKRQIYEAFNEVIEELCNVR